MKSISRKEYKKEKVSLMNNYLSIPKIWLKNKKHNKDIKIEKQIKSIKSIKSIKPIKLIINEEKLSTIKLNRENHSFPKINKNNKDISKAKIEKIKNNLEIKSHLGRKRKNENSFGKHNKFSDDNLRRKAKSLIIDYSLEFLNEKIKKIYKGNLGEGIAIKKLLPINKFVKSENTIQYNKDILQKKLGDIFSISISARYTYYSPNHNIDLIKRLLNERDRKKRLYFKKLFNITFLQCLKRFCGKDNCEELKDFKTFSDIKNKFKDEPEYINEIETYLIKFENNIKSKKGRKKKKITSINKR